MNRADGTAGTAGEDTTPRAPGEPGAAAGGSAPNGGRRLRLWDLLRAYLIAGVLVTAPLAITLYISLSVIDLIDRSVAALLAWVDPGRDLPFINIPGVGVALVVLALTLAGYVAAGYLGRTLVRFGEAAVGRLPVLRTIYATAKQGIGTVLADRSTAFRSVVMIEYPRPGLWSVGFLAGEGPEQVARVLGPKTLRVFMPSAINPTGGFLIFVPEAEVRRLAIPVEDGLKLVVSGGIAATPGKPAP